MKLSKGKEIGFNIGMTIIMLLFINYGLMPLLTEAPDYPAVPCADHPVPGAPTGCGTEWDTAQTTYQTALETHERSLFYASIIIGVLLLVAGLLLQIPAVNWGLMLAGALQFAIGSISYWNHLDKYTSFGISLLAVLVLGGVGYYFTKRHR